MVAKVEGLGKEGLQAWGQQMQTSVCKTDKQQGPAVQHRQRQSISLRNHVKEHFLKMYICAYTKSLCCTAETNGTSYINYASVKNTYCLPL